MLLNSWCPSIYHSPAFFINILVASSSTTLSFWYFLLTVVIPMLCSDHISFPVYYLAVRISLYSHFLLLRTFLYFLMFFLISFSVMAKIPITFDFFSVSAPSFSWMHFLPPWPIPSLLLFCFRFPWYYHGINVGHFAVVREVLNPNKPSCYTMRNKAQRSVQNRMLSFMRVCGSS